MLQSFNLAKKAETDGYSVCRMPLIKGKSAREYLEERGMWEQVRQQFPYRPMAKFYQTGTESMTNDADVSPDYRDWIHNCFPE